MKIDQQYALHLLQNAGAEALATHYIGQGMEKREFLAHFRDMIIEHEKQNGREVSSYYIAGDIYEKVFTEKGFSLFWEYKKERAKNSLPYYRISAKRAWQSVKHKRALQAWKESIGAISFYTDSNNVAHEYVDALGYRYVFKIEIDDFPAWEDMGCQGYGIDKRRGAPEFADHGSFTRHSGNGLKAWLDVGERDRVMWFFDVPQEYMRQFYDNKNLSKHAAYVAMVADTRAALEQDIENYCKTEFNYISVTLYTPEGEELETEGLGGCDTDYCTSGEAFYEHDLLETLRGKAIEHFSTVQPEKVAENFTTGAFI